LSLLKLTQFGLILNSIIEDFGMTEYAAKRNLKRCPSHPGTLLADVIIPATGRTKIEIANLLGISRQHLYDILRAAKPISPTVAVRLGKLFGDGAAPWLHMQAAHDTWHAEREVDLSVIPTIRAA
jgi:antitoxin HigA-1